MAEANWARVAHEIVQEIQARKTDQSVRLSPYLTCLKGGVGLRRWHDRPIEKLAEEFNPERAP
jgi:hypothetical protein